MCRQQLYFGWGCSVLQVYYLVGDSSTKKSFLFSAIIGWQVPVQRITCHSFVPSAWTREKVTVQNFARNGIFYKKHTGSRMGTVLRARFLAWNKVGLMLVLAHCSNTRNGNKWYERKFWNGVLIDPRDWCTWLRPENIGEGHSQEIGLMSYDYCDSHVVTGYRSGELLESHVISVQGSYG